MRQSPVTTGASRRQSGGYLAVVSNFGSGSLTPVRRETDGTVEMLDPIPVGDRPSGGG